MLKLLLYHKPSCPYCKAAENRLKMLVPEERVIFRNIGKSGRSQYERRTIGMVAPTLLIGFVSPTGQLIIGTDHETGKPMKVVGYLEPKFTNFIGEQFYGIEDLSAEIRQGNVTKGRLLEALKQYEASMSVHSDSREKPDDPERSDRSEMGGKNREDDSSN